MFKNHLEMIGRNETPSKKAKFWQSFVRSLKGSEDIRAHDAPRTRSWRPYSAYADIPPHFTSIYNDPTSPAERISSHGYRYLPVHRETYGYSPRPIYDHHYSRSIPSANYDVERAWNEHLKRMADIERRYPSRYGLYLKDKPNALVPQEYEPEDKPLFSESARAPSVGPRASSIAPRASSVAPRAGSYIPRARSVSPFSRAISVPPLGYGRCLSREPSLARSIRASSWDPIDRALYSKFDRPMPLETRASSPTPVKPGRWAPRPTEVAYDTDGLPIFHPRNRYRNLFNPSPYLPLSSITRDPWWWDLEDLRPFTANIPYYRLPSLLRDSFLSPVKRTYLWYRHPIRPFAHN